MKEELLKGLSEEQIAKIKACKNNTEVLELAKNEGIALTDEQLEAVSGGGCGSSTPAGAYCPCCNHKISVRFNYATENRRYYICCNCERSIYLDMTTYVWCAA